VEAIVWFDELPIAFSTARNPALEDLFSRKVIILHVEMLEFAIGDYLGVPETKKSRQGS
jgi:hypothetical protein